MNFRKFFRYLLLFEWLFGGKSKADKQTSSTDNPPGHDYGCDCDCGYIPPRKSGYSRSSWDDGHYAHNDYYHDSQDDYAHDFDEFEDDY
ncbi:hypothetical protein [uncultured Duncaniella sp.]|uniref:hypothetical protein n=1 Tax=uncultured Duncaniella sp. TaxID=2768039 RepID=UPI0032200A66